MEALFLLVPLSVIVLIIAAVLFLRMNANGQFDEGNGPAWSVLMDNDSPLVEDMEHPNKNVIVD